jgi:hypothetical protein
MPVCKRIDCFQVEYSAAVDHCVEQVSPVKILEAHFERNIKFDT